MRDHFLTTHPGAIYRKCNVGFGNGRFTTCEICNWGADLTEKNWEVIGKSTYAEKKTFWDNQLWKFNLYYEFVHKLDSVHPHARLLLIK